MAEAREIMMHELQKHGVVLDLANFNIMNLAASRSKEIKANYLFILDAIQ